MSTLSTSRLIKLTPSTRRISPIEPVQERLEKQAPVQDAAGPKKRPRLDLSDPRERKRGKSIFGLVLGTLNKAKVEDRQRNASEAVRSCLWVSAGRFADSNIIGAYRLRSAR